jgi:hypothetical protein
MLAVGVTGTLIRCSQATEPQMVAQGCRGWQLETAATAPAVSLLPSGPFPCPPWSTCRLAWSVFWTGMRPTLLVLTPGGSWARPGEHRSSPAAPGPPTASRSWPEGQALLRPQKLLTAERRRTGRVSGGGGARFPEQAVGSVEARRSPRPHDASAARWSSREGQLRPAVLVDEGTPVLPLAVVPDPWRRR